MKRVFKSLVFAILAIFLVGQAQAYQIKHIRSLNAAVTVVNGGFFDGVANPLVPQGGGVQWTVVLNGSSPVLSYQVQVQSLDGTWLPINVPGQGQTVSLNGAIPSNVIQFFGPFGNLRVSITAYTSGSLTADIYANF